MEVQNSNSSTKPEPSLLSLPDEPLYHILESLGAPRVHKGVFVPRHAFALALTNTRLLQIFRRMLTSIGPDIDPFDFTTFSNGHLLTVSRLAGEHLRELHLPSGTSLILSEVAKHCPNLEYVEMSEEDGEQVDGLQDVLKLSIRNLNIEFASPHSLSHIHSAPQQLDLTEMNESCFADLKRILKEPPAKLCLGFRIPQGYNQILPDLEQMIDTIKQACPKMESVNVSVCPDGYWDFGEAEEIARRHIHGTRTNSELSLCKTVKLNCHVTFPILEKVHPEAQITIGNNSLEFRDDGDGIYVRSLIMRNELLDLDLSRLHTVVCDRENYDARWKSLLSGKTLKDACLLSLKQAKELNMTISRLYINGCMELEEFSPDEQWDWLSKVRQLWVQPPVGTSSCGLLITYFQNMSMILDNFKGPQITIDSCARVHLDDNVNEMLLNQVKNLRRSIANYEARGGDAVCMTVILNRIVRRTIAPRLEHAGIGVQIL